MHFVYMSVAIKLVLSQNYIYICYAVYLCELGIESRDIILQISHYYHISSI